MTSTRLLITAMVLENMINVKASGARTRISTFLAGVFLLILVVGFGDVVAIIPMAALVAVMIVVAIGTFDWHSIQPATLRRMSKSETTVMVSTVAVTVGTHNLAIGVVVGVLVAMTLFARRVAHLTETHRELVEDRDGKPTALYRVTGELFFASSNDLYTSSSTSMTSTPWSSISPPPTSGTPLPSRRWTPSPPSTNARARPSRSSASTTPAPSATDA